MKRILEYIYRQIYYFFLEHVLITVGGFSLFSTSIYMPYIAVESSALKLIVFPPYTRSLDILSSLGEQEKNIHFFLNEIMRIRGYTFPGRFRTTFYLCMRCVTVLRAFHIFKGSFILKLIVLPCTQ